MAKRALVMCRECRKKFQRDDLVEGLDWIMPSKGWYYHRDCYDLWCQKRKDGKNINVQKEDTEYWTEIYDYLARVLKVSFDGELVGSQLKMMKNKGRTLKGILFALVYYYDIKGNKWKPEYQGVWIAELIYDESRRYWAERVAKQSDILVKIEEQIRAVRDRPHVQVKKQKKEKFQSRMLDAGEEEIDG